MTKRASRLVLLLITSYLCLAQVSSDFIPADVKRVGSRLACLCGACKNSVGDCPMIGCHYAAPARDRIGLMLKDGTADDAIVNIFVKEQGIKALVVPPAEGFNLLAWWMPVAAVLFGLMAIYMWISRMKQPMPAAPAIDPAVLEKYRDSIDKNLAKLE
ncbi:MAG: cytochrome c-type biogenesis protein CcmH [Acidobacteria bacterium]|nr:cytochrome c-type biogenesis protein CcmH [Acidobacteriota bacterium]